MEGSARGRDRADTFTGHFFDDDEDDDGDGDEVYDDDVDGGGDDYVDDGDWSI